MTLESHVPIDQAQGGTDRASGDSRPVAGTADAGGNRPLTPEQSKEARRLRRLGMTWVQVGQAIGTSHTRARLCIRAEDIAIERHRLQAEASRRANARARSPDGELAPGMRIEAVSRRVPNRGNAQSSSEHTHVEVSLPRVRFLEMRL